MLIPHVIDWVRFHGLEKIFHPRIKYLCARTPFLANRIRISEIIPWVRKPYLTQAFLSRLSREGYIGCIGTHAHGRQVTSLLCKGRHHVRVHLRVFRDFLKAYLKIKNSGEQEK